MSWQDKLKTQYSILCGPQRADGSRNAYDVLWSNPTKHIDYNIYEFVFKGVSGSLVKRGTPRGTQYNIEIYFQGDENATDNGNKDHIDLSKAFEKDAKDPTPWEIQHPYFGNLSVQPISLTFDNSVYNVTKITGTVIETLEDSGVSANLPDPVVEISAAELRIVNQFSDTYAADVPSPQISDIQQLRKNLNGVYAKVSKMINGYQQDVDTYLQYYNDANALINTGFYDTGALIAQTQRVLIAPAYFLDTVANRMNMFVAQLIILNRDMESLLDVVSRPTSTLKRLYENNAGTAILGLCLASVLNIGSSYNYRPDVLSAIRTIVDNFNTYLTNLWRLQSLNGGLIDGYIPNPDCITQLQLLVNYTTSTLFNISAGALQERVITLPYDTNVILLANELYGLQPDDSTIKNLIAQNNIGLNELLVLKQGRRIVYYV